VQGYELESFMDTFTRYTPIQTGTPEQMNDSSNLNRNTLETQTGTKWNINDSSNLNRNKTEHHGSTTLDQKMFQNVPEHANGVFQFKSTESLKCSSVPLSQGGTPANIPGTDTLLPPPPQLETYTEDDFDFEEAA
jgi:hypothetical protein